jgi:Flp pilus assembly protein TadG
MKTIRNWRRQARSSETSLLSTAPIKSECACSSAKAVLGALFAGSEEGGALIEMALTVPLMLALLVGMSSFGIAYKNQIVLTQATGIAAQYLAQIRTSSTDPCADVFTALKNAAPGLTSSSISVTVTMNSVTPTQTGNSCSGSQTNLVQGQPVSVYATYPCSLPIIQMYNQKFVGNAGTCSLAAKVSEYEY